MVQKNSKLTPDIHSIALYMGPHGGYNCFPPGRVDTLYGDTCPVSSSLSSVVDSHNRHHHHHHHHHHRCEVTVSSGWAKAASTPAYLVLTSARWHPSSSRLVRLSTVSPTFLLVFSFVGFPGGDTQCPLVVSYPADVPWPGLVSFLVYCTR